MPSLNGFPKGISRMSSSNQSVLEKLFNLNANQTNVRTEIMAGVTTFLAMCYIIIVNPLILGETGMGYGRSICGHLYRLRHRLFRDGLCRQLPYRPRSGAWV